MMAAVARLEEVVDLSKTAAAKRYGLRGEDLSREIREGRISVARWVGGRPRLNSLTLARELDERRCPGCGKITLSETGVCRDCVASVLQKGKPKSPEARAKMSRARRGKRLSAEHRANIGASLRQYEAEHRTCRCGTVFEVQRSNPDQRSCSPSCAAYLRWEEHSDTYNEAAREAGERKRRHERVPRSCEWCGTSLGEVPAHRLAAGRGRFCSHSHVMKWLWARRPDAVRQPRLGRVVTCACGRETRYLRPSRMARERCRHCQGTSGEVRAHLALLREEQRAELKRVKQAEGLVDRQEARVRLRRSGGHLTRWAASAVLPPARRQIGGVTYLLFKEGDVARVEGRLAREPQSKRKWVEAARLRLKRRGPKPRQGPSAFDELCSELFPKARAELVDRYEREMAAGHNDVPKRPPSNWAVAERVASQVPAALLPNGYFVAPGQLHPERRELATRIVWRSLKETGTA